MQLSQGASHRQPELSTRPQPGVARDCLVNGETNASLESMMRQKSGGELAGSVGVQSLRLDHLGWRRLQQEGGRRDGGPKTTEAAAEFATEVENTEVKPGGGLDE